MNLVTVVESSLLTVSTFKPCDLYVSYILFVMGRPLRQGWHLILAADQVALLLQNLGGQLTGIASGAGAAVFLDMHVPRHRRGEPTWHSGVSEGLLVEPFSLRKFPNRIEKSGANHAPLVCTRNPSPCDKPSGKREGLCCPFYAGIGSPTVT